MATKEKRTPQVDDLEIVADVVRLVRAAPLATEAATIFAQVRSMHPEIDDIRIRKACGTAADMLLKQHEA